MKTLSTSKSQNLTKEELLNAIISKQSLCKAECVGTGKCIASI